MAHDLCHLVSAPLANGLDQLHREALTRLGARVQRIGSSVEGRELWGFTLGDPGLPLVSIVAGAHPDEPAGPAAACALALTWADSSLATRVRLAVVPHLDVDGTAAQRDWLTPWPADGGCDPAAALSHRLRRSPGEDREFAWPGAPWPGCVLPECAAAAAFLDEQGPAIAHLSLHGMFIASGAWFLVDHLGLADPQLWQDLRTLAGTAGLGLHDMPRNGDKGFRRSGVGFCTTPSGPAMRRWACAEAGNGHDGWARSFGYGSMDSARQRCTAAGAPPPLCAVSEFPLIQLAASRGQSVAALRARMATVFAEHPDPADAAAALGRLGAQPVSFPTVVSAMVQMSNAVIAAALRRSLVR